MYNQQSLIKILKQKGVLKSASIEKALSQVDRADFVLEDLKNEAYLDEALSIDWGQTISQPFTVVFMLELLEVKKDDVVLDVGSGSGWQTTLLAHLVGDRGKVFAMEILPEICQFGQNNLKKYSQLAKRVTFYCKNASRGLPDIAKKQGGFDRIIAAACVKEVPAAWREQLKIGGRLVYPKNHSLFEQQKKGQNDFSVKEHPGFVFVPFTG